MAVREGLTDEMTFEHIMWLCDWTVFREEGTVSAKALKQVVLGRFEEQPGGRVTGRGGQRRGRGQSVLLHVDRCKDFGFRSEWKGEPLEGLE